MAGEGVLATLRAGWDAIDVPKAVIGGLALTAWKHARSTRDDPPSGPRLWTCRGRFYPSPHER